MKESCERCGALVDWLYEGGLCPACDHNAQMDAETRQWEREHFGRDRDD